MGIYSISPTAFPTYIAESTDIVGGKIKGAGIIGGTVYLTDTLTWKIVSGNLQLVDFKLPANYTALPSAASQEVSTDEDVQKAITLSGIKADAIGLEYIITQQPEHGTLTGVLPAVTYVPDENFNGTDEFTFIVNDGMSNSVPATISITINPINDIPVAQSQDITTDEDTPVNITLVATDNDNDDLTYSIVDAPLHGGLTGDIPNLVYTPDANYFGIDSFTFKANDGVADSNVSTVGITIESVNDLPFANNQIIHVVPNSSAEFMLDYSDEDMGVLVYALTVEPLHGELTGTQPNLTYTPDVDYHGTDSFEYTVTDSEDAVAGAIVSINVNTEPTATNQPGVNATQGVAEEITLVGLDAEDDPLTYIIVTQPAHGELTGTAPNVIYTSEAEYTGDDMFTFKVNDGFVDSEIATVNILVSI